MFAVEWMTPLLSHLEKTSFLECSRLHHRQWTDSHTTSILWRTFCSHSTSVWGLQVYRKAWILPVCLLPQKSRNLCFCWGPSHGKTTFPCPRCPRDAVNMLLVLQGSWTDEKRKTNHHPRMGNESISYLAELRIALYWLRGHLVPQPVSSTQKEWGIAGSGRVLVRRKAGEERIEAFTLNEEWPS